ncbi:MAG: serine hydrolase [Cyclobacteriaceae bacterium]|nr:serine hydrolase [Cyclobacteriaceae bacterium]
MLKKVFFSILFILIELSLSGQDLKKQWVDSIFQTLNNQEKIGQLFMLSTSSYLNEDQNDQLTELIKDYRPGGILITQGGPKSHATLINKLQSKSQVPLLVGLRGEWGLGQTLDSTLSFQKPFLLGAIQNDNLIFELGEEIAREMHELGIHINFAPNVNFEVQQPYPNSLRYLSDNPSRASHKALAYIKGLQKNGVLACAMYFPFINPEEFTHQLDSSLYIDIPVDSLALSVLSQLSKAEIDGILTTNISIIKQEQENNSKVLELFVSDVIKSKLNYKGLIFGEIPHLQKIVGDQPDGEIEKLAFEMGHDMLIDPEDLGDAVKRINRAVRRDKKLEARLDDAVKKILTAKYNAGLATAQIINTDNLISRLSSPSAKALKHKISESAVTVLRNSKNSIPISLLEGKKFVSISIGKEDQNEFSRYLSKYAWVQHYALRQATDTMAIKKSIANADVVIVGVFPFSSSFIKNISPFFKRLASKKEIIICHFGDPQELAYWEGMPSVIACYTDEDWMPKIAAQIMFGGLSAHGILPVTVGEFIEGQGITTKTLNRFSYGLPEEVGMDSKTLEQIDIIAREAIDIGATPGSHVLVAKDGKVIYEHSNGWLTYQNKIAVTENTIYDLASVTKVTATLQTVMFMYEKGLIDVNKKVSVYLPELKNSNKKDYTIKDILTHQAGLWPFLPFWAETVKNGTLMPEYYSTKKSTDYPYPVAEDVFASKAMKDSLWQWIIKSKVREKPPRTVFDYRYSDMGFYILQHLAEKLLNQPMQDFLDQNLYEPLGAYTLGYLPLNKFPSTQIAPTEDDKLFRKKLLTGYVHDQGAAMHGNIAGHAGLFGNANDLAKLGQMLLQRGHYGGEQFYKPETIDFFIGKQYETSRRGLGWDKPTVSDWAGPTTLYASPKTFGHTGFTGTCIWVDPEFNLVFVYLSNRVYPDMTNNKLLNANIRPRIQEIVYKAMFNYRQY